MSGWICPSCFSTDAPEWNWIKVQGEEGYRLPTCPHCGYEMEDADECPLCEELKPLGKVVCFGCWWYLNKSLIWAVDSVCLKKTPVLTKWKTIRDIAETMVERCEE